MTHAHAPLHLCGWLDHPDRLKVAATMPKFSDATSALLGDGLAGDLLLYKAWKDVLGSYPSYAAQEIGDCTSHGGGHALDLLQCVEIALGHEKIGYQETDTEVLYGLGREVAGMLGSGDGCYGAAIARALTTLGAVPRKDVGPYSGSRARQFGARGVPVNLKQEALEFKLGASAPVTTREELCAALANGHPVTVASSQGFTMHRDAGGICQPSGRWDHQMCIVGVIRSDSTETAVICQSWGPNVPDGPTPFDMPSYCFRAPMPTVAKMLQVGDSFAFSLFPGFEHRDLPTSWTIAGFAGH
jgi:hypothetical protein